MIIDPQSVQIGLDVDFFAEGYNEIIQNVNVILSTPKGTVPFDRDFGVNIEFVDLPLERAKQRITVEYIAAVKKYEPRVKVKQVIFSHVGTSGKLIPKVVLSFVN